MLSSRLKALVKPTSQPSETQKLTMGCPGMASFRPKTMLRAETTHWANNLGPGWNRTKSSIKPSANIREAQASTIHSGPFVAGITQAERVRTTSQIETPPNWAGVPLCQRSG